MNEKFERGGHTFSAGVAWNTIRLKTWVGRSFPGPGGLEPPMVHASRRELNSNPVTKQRLVVMFLGPTIASKANSQHQIQKKNFPGGAASRPP